MGQHIRNLLQVVCGREKTFLFNAVVEQVSNVILTQFKVLAAESLRESALSGFPYLFTDLGKRNRWVGRTACEGSNCGLGP